MSRATCAGVGRLAAGGLVFSFGTGLVRKVSEGWLIGGALSPVGTGAVGAGAVGAVRTSELTEELRR